MNRLWIRLSLAFSGVILSTFVIIIVSVVITATFSSCTQSLSLSELDSEEMNALNSLRATDVYTRIPVNSCNVPISSGIEWKSYTTLTKEEVDALEFLEAGNVLYNVSLEDVSMEFSPTTPLLYFAAVIGIPAIIAGVLMSRQLTKPLESLHAGVEAIGNNQLNYRINVEGTDEVRQVAKTFNRMAADLEMAESLRQNLLADVAHELRHPVHILKGSLHAILDDVYPLDKKQIAQLVDQTDHITGLINDLHELAQAEARQLPMYKEHIDIAQLVKDTTAVFKPAAYAKGIKLQVELLGSMPIVHVDPSRIRQVLHNLLNNGLKHTGKNGRLHITVEQASGGLQISIADTGTGIKAEDIPHVFDRFYRADNARSRDHNGAGLGLAIARAIVDAHGGHINVTSDGVNQGSTFTIWLPI